MGGRPPKNDLGSRIERMEKELYRLQHRSTLRNASISGGDLTVKGGGDVRVIEGGNILVEDSGNLQVIEGGNILVSGGNVEVSDEGDVIVRDGGRLVVKDSSGASRIVASGTTGDLRIRSGGDVIVDPGGVARSSDFAAGSSGWRIAGDGDAEFNAITLREGIVSNDALAARVEPHTDGTRSHPTGTNTASLSLSVSVPSWATTTSLLATGSVGAFADPGVRFHGELVIAGDSSGTQAQGSTDDLSPYDAVPVTHHRTWSPSGTFNVRLESGAAPTSATPDWELQLTIMAVFSR